MLVLCCEGLFVGSHLATVVELCCYSTAVQCAQVAKLSAACDTVRDAAPRLGVSREICGGV
jgi:hypothetical protein